MLFVGQTPDPVTRHSNLFVRRYEMAAGERFGFHRHAAAQLSWAPSGVLQADVDGTQWMLPPTLALWIPGGALHDIGAMRSARFHNLYFAPGRMTPAWPDPIAVAMPPVLRELVVHFAEAELHDEQRLHVERVIADLLTPVGAVSTSIAIPSAAEARDLALALVDDPADHRTLDQWGRQIGASARTLQRQFVTDTGLTFQDWRRLLRVRSSLMHLVGGAAVAVVARRVGYRTTSAYIAAFRRTTGRTPGAYRNEIDRPVLTVEGEP